jgi:hypothetical protein
MKMKVLALLTAGGLLTVLSGCVGTVDGRSRGGVPFSKDTIESRYERPVPLIFEAAKKVLAYNGTLVAENTINNSVEAKVDTRTVWVAVDEVEPKVSRVRTQARKKGGGGDIDLAAEIDKQIALQLK